MAVPRPPLRRPPPYGMAGELRGDDMANSLVRLMIVLIVVLISSCTSRIQHGAVGGRVSGACDNYLRLSGTSADSKILAIPNAKITIKNISTGVLQTTRTDFSGTFKAEGISPGRYEISVGAQPFKTQVRTLDVRPGKTTDASVRLLTSREPQDVVFISGCPVGLMGGVVPRDLSSVEIQLRRTGCYGPCPVYTIHLFGDGRVEYRGDLNVPALGIRKYQVPPSTVAGLARRFFEQGFFSFCATYRQPATDLPAIETTIQIAGITRTVFVYGDAAPEGLQDLDEEIENVTKVGQLVKSAP